MGCASSKQALRDKAIAPLARSYSLPIHHPAQGKGDSHHVVALTSTTLGSLKLDLGLDHTLDQNLNNDDDIEGDEKKKPKKKNNNNTEEQEEEEDEDESERLKFSTEVLLLQAKAWSNKMEGKMSQIAKTPILQTPPNEPETINAWELMDGLEDSSPLRSFSFHGFSEMQIPEIIIDETQKTKTTESPKPIWLQLNASDPVIADFDPEIISHFRKALDELSPCHCRPRFPEIQDKKSPGVGCNNRFSKIGTVQERIRAFQERINQRTVKSNNGLVLSPPKCPPRGEGRVVIYFTSLRGVRKTYEDCCDVRLILRGYGVRLDERDVSMHQGFRDELYELLGGRTESFGGLTLPRVFVKGSYVGGAEEVRQMHESGDLGNLMQGCEKLEEGACEGCGDVRFVLCETCFGSCKVFDEEEEVFFRCPDCNENGITCCPVCCI